MTCSSDWWIDFYTNNIASLNQFTQLTYHVPKSAVFVHEFVYKDRLTAGPHQTGNRRRDTVIQSHVVRTGVRTGREWAGSGWCDVITQTHSQDSWQGTQLHVEHVIVALGCRGDDTADCAWECSAMLTTRGLLCSVCKLYLFLSFFLHHFVIVFSIICAIQLKKHNHLWFLAKSEQNWQC